MKFLILSNIFLTSCHLRNVYGFTYPSSDRLRVSFSATSKLNEYQYHKRTGFSLQANTNGGEEEEEKQSPQAEIDKVTREAEDALKEAEKALAASADDEKQTKGNDVIPSPPSKPAPVAAVRDPKKDAKLAQLEKEAVLSAVGGVLFGTLTGISIDFYSMTNDLSILGIDPNTDPIVLPAVLGVTAAATGFGLGKQDNFAGTAIRTILGGPLKALGNAIKSSITEAVDNTVDTIVSIPENVQNSVKRKAQETADEIAQIPEKIKDAAVDAVEKTVDEIKATPGKIAEGAKQKVKDTVEDVERKAEQVVEDIKAAPGKIAQEAKDAVIRTVEDVEDAVEEAVEKAIRYPGEKLDEFSTLLGVQKSETPPPLLPVTPKPPQPPLPPLADSTPTETKTAITPSFPNLGVDLSKVQAPKVEIPKIDVLKVPQPPKTPPLPKTPPPKTQPPPPKTPPPQPQKEEKKEEKEDKFIFNELTLQSYKKSDEESEEESTETPQRGFELPKLQLPKIETPPPKAPLQPQPPKEMPKEDKSKLEREAALKKKQEETQAASLARRKKVAAQKKAAAMAIAEAREVRKSQQAQDFIQNAEPGKTLSLGFFGLGQKSDKDVVTDVPTLSNWVKNRDGSITGLIKGSPAFDDGEKITTSRIVDEAVSGTTVQTASGSRYYLGAASTASPFGGIFSKTSSSDSEEESDERTELKRTAAQIAAEARQREAEEKRAAAQAATEERQRVAEEKRAAAQAAAEEKRAAAQAAAEERQREAEEKRAAAQAAAEERQREAEAKRAADQAAAQAAAEARQREADEKRAAADRIAAEFAAAEAKKREEARLAAEEARKRREASAKSTSVQTKTPSTKAIQTKTPPNKDAMVEKLDSKPGATFSLGLFNFGDTSSASTPAVASVPNAPKGVPSLSQWKLNSGGTITGIISGSRMYPDGEVVTTSVINSDAVENTVVLTVSGSRYYLVDAAPKGFGGIFGGTAKPSPPAFEPKAASRVSAPSKIDAKETVETAKPGATISLGFFGFRQKSTAASTPEVPSKSVQSAPRGVPALSNWTQNKDGSITGVISGSRAFKDGEKVTTSPITSDAVSGSVVATTSGTKYYLDSQSASSGRGLFGRFRSGRKFVESKEVEDKGKSAAEVRKEERARKQEEAKAAAEARKVEAERKKEEARAAAEARKREAEQKREEERAEAKARKREAEEQRERARAAAEALKRESEQQRVAEQKKKDAAEARLREAEQKKADAVAAAEARKKEAEERKRKAAEAKAAAQSKASSKEATLDEAKAGQTISLGIFGFGRQNQDSDSSEKAQKAELADNAVQNAKSGSTISLGFLNFGSRSDTDSSTIDSTPKILSSAPNGVPTITNWKKNRDGSVSGNIVGSKSYSDGETVTTSKLVSDAVGGAVVMTVSGSRYYLQSKGSKPMREKTSVKKTAAPKAMINNKKKVTPLKQPPAGVPKLVNWKKNFNGSITGFISGSRNFEEGEKITTSPIVSGNVGAGEVVKTGSGSSYYLV